MNLKQTIMRQDGLDETEAEQVIDDVREMMIEAIERGDFFEAEEIFTGELGLEPDYMMEIIPL